MSHGSVHIIKSADKLNSSQIKGATHEIKAKSFSAEVPATLLEIHSVHHAVEALPITNPHTMMTLHFTQPQHDVVIDAPSGQSLYFNISTLGDTPVSYDLKLKPVQRVKLSVTFDSSRVDEVQAVKFLNKLQTYLNDPESMLL